jgi:hypothetical protein
MESKLIETLRKKIKLIKKNIDIYKNTDFFKKFDKVNNETLKKYLMEKKEYFLTLLINNYYESKYDFENFEIEYRNNILNDKDFDMYLDTIKKRIHNIFFIDRAIVDLFLLRRVIDKEYVKNAYIYSGSLHVLNFLMLFQNNGFELVDIDSQYIREVPNYKKNIINFFSMKKFLDLIHNNDFYFKLILGDNYSITYSKSCVKV